MEDDKLKEKEQEELRALLDKPDGGSSSDEDNQDNEGKQDEKETPGNKGNSADASSEDNEENSESNNETEDNEGNNDEGKKASEQENGDQDNKDRWYGKSREEVIKAYESLEARVTALESKTNPENKSNGDKNSNSVDEKTENNEGEENSKLGIPSVDELQKMTPTDFAKWVLGRIDEGVKRTIETQEKIRDSVHTEITEAKKEHPLQDPDYRKMVLAIIDAASAKGTTIPLKEACSQVDAFLGKHKGESEDLSNEEKSRLKKAKAQVESGAGAPTQPDGSDAETIRIQKALAGSGSRSPLGGLGI